MKKMLTCLVNGLLFIGVVGIAQAAGCNNGEDFYTEGPPYERDCKQHPVVYTKLRCEDDGNLYTEGMGVSPCVKGKITLISKSTKRGNLYTEGYSDEELENILRFKKLNNTETAAGN